MVNELCKLVYANTNVPFIYLNEASVCVAGHWVDGWVRFDCVVLGGWYLSYVVCGK